MKLKKTEIERLMYIEAHLLIHGTIGREAIKSRFGVSIETASALISKYKEACPEQMALNNKPRKPHYDASATCQPCLFISQESAKTYLQLSDNLNETVLFVQNNKEV